MTGRALSAFLIGMGTSQLTRGMIPDVVMSTYVEPEGNAVSAIPSLAADLNHVESTEQPSATATTVESVVNGDANTGGPLGTVQEVDEGGPTSVIGSSAVAEEGQVSAMLATTSLNDGSPGGDTSTVSSGSPPNSPTTPEKYWLPPVPVPQLFSGPSDSGAPEILAESSKPTPGADSSPAESTFLESVDTTQSDSTPKVKSSEHVPDHHVHLKQVPEHIDRVKVDVQPVHADPSSQAKVSTDVGNAENDNTESQNVVPGKLQANEEPGSPDPAHHTHHVNLTNEVSPQASLNEEGLVGDVGLADNRTTISDIFRNFNGSILGTLSLNQTRQTTTTAPRSTMEAVNQAGNDVKKSPKLSAGKGSSTILMGTGSLAAVVAIALLQFMTS